jgi:organic hydroperoxide reductase OsmC/OhrA
MRTDDIVHHVTVSLSSGYRFVVSFDDLPGDQGLAVDEPAPLGEGKLPNAAALLAAAVGNCLAASLLHCLKRSRAQVQDLTARVSMTLTRNDVGRYRIAGIDVELSPALAGHDAGRLGRCEDLFEDFCIVTQSVRAGIPVNVTVKATEPEPLELVT